MLLFVCVKSGYYLFLREDRIVAEIKRHVYFPTPGSKWSKVKYILEWNTGAVEEYRTLKELGEDFRYDIMNFGGYNNLLGKKSDGHRKSSQSTH